MVGHLEPQSTAHDMIAMGINYQFGIPNAQGREPAVTLKLEPGKLTWEAACDLAMHIREADLRECLNDPLGALVQGMTSGDAWTVLNGSRRIGAFGYTDYGTIWSLFVDLTLPESVAVLRHTRLWVRTMLAASRQKWLYNFVHADNEAAIGWLLASQCFDIDWEAIDRDGAKPSFYFTTRRETAA